jgi:hypothetical protein
MAKSEDSFFVLSEVGMDILIYECKVWW